MRSRHIFCGCGLVKGSLQVNAGVHGWLQMAAPIGATLVALCNLTLSAYAFATN